MLQINKLNFRYENSGKRLFQDFSFSIRKGEVIAVRGSSGSGKTTLLHIICGVIPKMIKGDFSGQILWNNQNIADLTLPQTATQISLLLQEPDNQLFFPTVEQELAFGAENLKMEPNVIDDKITQILNELQISHLRFAETNTLSFGQKKLVTFASLLTLSPQVYLLDELSAGLSEKHLLAVQNILKKLAEEGKIVILADHNPTLLDLARRSIRLKENTR